MFFLKVVVAKNWHKEARIDEVRECFKIFDKKDKSFITSGDIVSVLQNHVDFQINEQEVKDFIFDCVGPIDGNITYKEFAKIYLS